MAARRRLPRDARLPPGSATDFANDIAMNVFPSRWWRDGNTETYRLSGPTEEQGKAARLLASLSRHRGHDFDEVVCEAGNQIAQDVCSTGFCGYDVIRADEGPELVYRSPLPIREWLNLARARLAKPGKTRSVWYAWIPNSLGGPLRHRRLLRALARVEDILPRYRMDMLTGGRSGAAYENFDAAEYSRLAAQFFARETARWGWSARSKYHEHCTEAFAIRRWLVSGRARALLRDHILDRFQHLLDEQVPGVRLIREEGREVSDFDDKIRALSEGTIETGALLDWLSGRDV